MSRYYFVKNNNSVLSIFIPWGDKLYPWLFFAFDMDKEMLYFTFRNNEVCYGQLSAEHKRQAVEKFPKIVQKDGDVWTLFEHQNFLVSNWTRNSMC